jgi:hypothetical protein
VKTVRETFCEPAVNVLACGSQSLIYMRALVANLEKGILQEKVASILLDWKQVFRILVLGNASPI